MNRAQILIFGGGDALTNHLRELAHARSLWLRDVRHVKTCLNLLRQGGPGLVVLRVGTNLEQELSLLAQVKHFFPATAVVVVGNMDHPTLAGLCWDLGASYVLFPPVPMERLREVISGFLP